MPPRASRRPNNEFAGPHKDEDYWRSESDEEEEGSTAEGTAPSSRRAQGQQSTAEQDDQLFDPTSDERDAAWVEKARKGRLSDAILSCPGCFTTLTVDCQQHAQYHNQFRAMLVMNCDVDEGKLLQTAGEARGRRHGGGKKSKTAAGPGAGPGAGQAGSHDGTQQQQQQAGGAEGGGGGAMERFYAVRCATCGTEVGVRDEEEVYHFFHVFPSNA